MALGLHVCALVVWIAMLRQVERWIWLTVILGFVTVIAHRVGEVLNYNPIPYFSHITAVAIAVVAFNSVLQTRRYIKRSEHMAAVHARLESLAREVKSREPIAPKIAEIISDLRFQIAHYEEQAKCHDLPLFQK